MGLRDRLRALLRGADATTEAESPRDGAFSYSSEWHAFTHGLYLGFTSRALITPPAPTDADVLDEPAYYRGGYLIGTLLQLTLIAGGLYYGFGDQLGSILAV